MGPVMFEVGLFFFVVMFYFTIGYYYRLRLGILMCLSGIILYFLGLAGGLGLLWRFALLMLPILVLMKKHGATDLEFDKTKVYCSKCGWPNEPDSEFCSSPHCGKLLEKDSDTTKLTYYFPPRLIVIIGASVFMGMMFYETTRTGKIIITFIYALWPFLAFLIILILIYRKLSK
jgi:hypothetical protein